MPARRQSGPHKKLSPQRQANDHAKNTKGLYTLAQYPYGGDTPFGGRLIYSGSHDDDGGWSLLRLRKTETVSAPYTDVSAEEVDFETRLRLEQERVRPFFMVDKAKQIPDDSTSLQLQLADKYFQTYLNKKPPVLFATRPRPDRSRRRRQGQSDLRRAPGFLSWRQNRAIEPQVIPLKSGSALLHTLGQYWLGCGQQSKARRAFTQIAIWRVSPWHGVQATRQLWQMNQER